MITPSSLQTSFRSLISRLSTSENTTFASSPEWFMPKTLAVSAIIDSSLMPSAYCATSFMADSTSSGAMYCALRLDSGMPCIGMRMGVSLSPVGHRKLPLRVTFCSRMSLFRASLTACEIFGVDCFMFHVAAKRSTA